MIVSALSDFVSSFNPVCDAVKCIVIMSDEDSCRTK